MRYKTAHIRSATIGCNIGRQIVIRRIAILNGCAAMCVSNQATDLDGVSSNTGYRATSIGFTCGSRQSADQTACTDRTIVKRYGNIAGGIASRNIICRSRKTANVRRIVEGDRLRRILHNNVCLRIAVIYRTRRISAQTTNIKVFCIVDKHDRIH